MGMLDGKVALVTGAGGGLGRAHALLLAQEGASVVVNDLGGSRDGTGASSSMADAVVEEIKAAGGQAVADYGNVTNRADVEAMIQACVDNFGKIDICIANAGILRDKSYKNMSDDMWDIVIDVHLKGTYLTTKVAYDRMLEQGTGGRIIVTSSTSGLLGNFGQTNYGAAKAGIAGLMRCLWLEGLKYGITVNVLAPTATSRMTTDILPEDIQDNFPPGSGITAHRLAVHRRGQGSHRPPVPGRRQQRPTAVLATDTHWQTAPVRGRLGRRRDRREDTRKQRQLAADQSNARLTTQTGKRTRMNFGFSEEQNLLRDQVTRFMAEACPMSKVRELAQTESRFAADLWQQAAELGWLGLIVPETYGGVGLKWVDLTVVLEATGRGLCPLPMVSHALSCAAIMECGSDAQKSQWLPAMAAGAGHLHRLRSTTIQTGSTPKRFSATAIVEGDQVTLSGVKPFVNDAFAPTTFCSRCARPTGLGLAALGKDQVTVQTQPIMDTTKPTGSIDLSGVTIPTEYLLNLSDAQLAYLTDCGAMATTAEMVGAAEAILDSRAATPKTAFNSASPSASTRA